jgi:hypothetical protein
MFPTIHGILGKSATAPTPIGCFDTAQYNQLWLMDWEAPEGEFDIYPDTDAPWVPAPTLDGGVSLHMTGTGTRSYSFVQPAVCPGDGILRYDVQMGRISTSDAIYDMWLQEWDAVGDGWLNVVKIYSNPHPDTEYDLRMMPVYTFTHQVYGDIAYRWLCVSHRSSGTGQTTGIWIDPVWTAGTLQFDATRYETDIRDLSWEDGTTHAFFEKEVASGDPYGLTETGVRFIMRGTGTRNYVAPIDPFPSNGVLEYKVSIQRNSTASATWRFFLEEWDGSSWSIVRTVFNNPSGTGPHTTTVSDSVDSAKSYRWRYYCFRSGGSNQVQRLWITPTFTPT